VIRVVVDTGPLVALLNKRDQYHSWARSVLDTIEPPIFTCEAVLAETAYLLGKVKGGSDAVLAMLANDIVEVDFSLAQEAAPVRALMSRFQSVPMSLADACLVRMTELEPKSVVLTLDRDFLVYRRNKRLVVPTIMPELVAV
jgi:predicted nucleic acid-binding protein